MRMFIKHNPLRLYLVMEKRYKILSDANECISIDVLLIYRIKSNFSEITNHFFSRYIMGTTEC